MDKLKKNKKTFQAHELKLGAFHSGLYLVFILSVLTSWVEMMFL